MRNLNKRFRRFRRSQRVRGKHSILGILGILGILSFLPEQTRAYYPTLTYRYDHHLFTLNPNDYPTWKKTEEVWSFNGMPMQPPQSLRVDGDFPPDHPVGVTRSLRSVWDTDAIAKTIGERIGSVIDRPRGEVTIRKRDGAVEFEGVGFLGKTLEVDMAAMLTAEALDRSVIDIQLPVTLQQPVMNVLDPDLQDRGIMEVVAIGESNFAHSTTTRRHNIQTGLARFNGHVVAQGETFSFNTVLGPVNAATGYLKELVILGEKTLPDYGGGLCQVSTTAYRGVWEYGFPIIDRRNHSFAVSYYAPQGTDATIYPPNTDIKFNNDSPGSLLIQTHMEGDNAFFIYYGTRDKRTTEIIGPYIWDRRGPPPDRTEYTTDLPEGVKRVVGKAVPGMQSAWFRITQQEDGTQLMEPVYSYYEARPNYTQIGGSPKAPSWLGDVVQ